MRQDEFWGEIKLTGIITVASRMKRVSDLLFAQVQELYDTRNRNFKSSWFAILATIKKEGKIDFKTLASRNNISSPAVSQIIKELEQLELVKVKSGQDKRSRFIYLTAKGTKTLDDIAPDLVDVEKVLIKLLGNRTGPLLDTLGYVEKELREKSISEILEVKIIRFDSKYTKDFAALNREWLEENFTLEQSDEEILANPEKLISEKGGEIFLAIQDKTIVGTLALIPHDKSRLEISKLAVKPEMRRRGIAKALLNKAIEFAKQNSYQEVFALTNSQLEAAVSFYKRRLFTRSSCQDPRYKRVDEKYKLKI